MILHPGGFGPTVVAASGPIVGGGFNALAIARDACRQSRTIDAIIDRFMTQAEQPYRAMHDWLLRTESEYVHRRSSSVIEPIPEPRSKAVAHSTAARVTSRGL